MCKCRNLLLLFGFVFVAIPSSAQVDTLVRHGFADYKEAADSLFARLIHKKYQSIQVFTINESVFLKETRKHDTSVAPQMVRGQWLSYWGKAERSYKKVYKKLGKRNVKAGRTKVDTVLLYRNSGAADVQRAELYIVQKKYKAYIKYQLWKVDGLWYFTGKFDLVEEKTKK